jgi:L-alanine-DL-glutamate epimerase-like enolase superfamily enzyme
MTIRSVEAIPLSLPFDIGGPKPIFAGKTREMEMLLIRVETEDGFVGWGESFGFSIWPATVQVLERLVRPLAVGRDESNIEELLLEISRKLHPLGRAGAVIFAISGLDIALWDIQAQRQQRSLAHCLSTQPKTAIPAYASLIRYNNPDLVAKNAALAVSKGFKAIKLHETGFAEIKAAREAIGPDIHLMVDTNCPWTPEQAIEMCQQLEPLNLLWIEEPVWPPEDHIGLAKVKRDGKIPTAAGENALGYNDLKSLMSQQAVDYLQPSVTKIGGVSEMLKIMGLANNMSIKIAPHSPYMGPGLIATAHLIAAQAQEIFLEYTFCQMDLNPLGQAILTQEGFFPISSEPGLGLTIDMDIVQQILVS